MRYDYTVQRGDCIQSIAQAFRVDPQKIWAANPRLHGTCEHPGTLIPGHSIVVVVDEKQIGRPTDAVHVHNAAKSKCCVRLQLFDYHKPRANQPYKLVIDGETVHRGTSDGNGLVEVPIRPGAKNAVLTVGRDAAIYKLNFGYLEPVGTVRGVQSRLNNLGFVCGAEDGIAGERTRAALLLFQRAYRLKRTGEIDQATRDKLKSLHDTVCPLEE
jgi:N-acetylmuramoyl-L-alanine amidase